jgi:hypothetical protein
MINYLLIPILAFALTSCIMPAPQPIGNLPTNPQQPAQPNSGIAENGPWYDKGHSQGVEDGAAGLPQNWRHYTAAIRDAHSQNQFAQGYTAGYAAGTGETDRLDNRDAALNNRYTDGYNMGEADRRRGMSANPDRHGDVDDKYGTTGIHGVDLDG